ncbi:MAG: hypothetical protein M3362_20435 [Acidobacteriota bacterium]|nr:hypothetical protein [Acidobacteriota bacterium]
MSPSIMGGLATERAGGAWHGAGGMSHFTKRAAGGALKVTQSNKRMHATRDTRALIYNRGAGGRVMRGVRTD